MGRNTDRHCDKLVTVVFVNCNCDVDEMRTDQYLNCAECSVGDQWSVYNYRKF